MTTMPMPGPVNTIAAISVFGMSFAFAQPPDSVHSFEVASIKTVAPGAQVPGHVGQNGGPGTSDPGRITYNVTLQYLVSLAYDVPIQQVTGPDWLSTERYTIEATLPPGTTKKQLPTMVRSLLADRFGLLSHRETRQVTALVLGVAKTGLKLEKSKPQTDSALDVTPFAGSRGPYGFSPVAAVVGSGGIPRINPMGGNERLIVKDESMDAFAVLLADELSRPVVNETGLTGEYDIVVYYLDERPLPPALAALRSESNSPNNAPPLRSAIEQQLGLRVEEKKAPVEFLVIDHMEKAATAN